MLVEADAVRPTTQPRRLTFRHPLVRHYAYASTRPGWRLAAHERAAALLRDRGAGALAIAQHVERCARPGDIEAIACLTEAGRLTATRAPGSAAHWYGAAWALVQEAEHLDPANVELLYALGLALTVSGDGERALELGSTLIEALPATDPVRFRFELGRVSILETIGRSAAALEHLRAVQLEVGDGAPMEQLMIAAMRAALESDRGDADAAAEQLQRGRALAAQLGVPQLPAMMQALGAWTALRSGDHAAAVAACDEAAAVFDELHAAALDPTPSLLGALAGSEMFPAFAVALVRAEWRLGRLADARRHIDHALYATRVGKWPILATTLLAHAALVEQERGHRAEAEEFAAAAEEEAAMIDSRESEYWAAYCRAALAEPTTRTRDAVEAAEAALRAARHAGRGPQAAEAALLAGGALLADDLPGRAIELLERRAFTRGEGEAERCGLLADAWLARDDRERAAEWARCAEAAALHAGCPAAAGLPPRWRWRRAMRRARRRSPQRRLVRRVTVARCSRPRARSCLPGRRTRCSATGARRRVCCAARRPRARRPAPIGCRRRRCVRCGGSACEWCSQAARRAAWNHSRSASRRSHGSPRRVAPTGRSPSGSS